MKKVFVNGYGSIGSRITQFIKDDPEIQILGVGKYSPDAKVQEAISNGFNVYVPKSKESDFKKFSISGNIETILDDCDLVIDAAPGRHGFKNKIIPDKPRIDNACDNPDKEMPLNISEALSKLELSLIHI